MRIRVIRGQTPSNPGAEIQIHESHLSPRINRSTCRFQNHISATKSPDSCEFVSFVVKPPATPGAGIQIHESPESPTNNRSTCGFQNQISATKSPDSCKFVSFVVNHPATPAQELTTTNHPNHPANNRRTCGFQKQIRATRSPDSCDSWTIAPLPHLTLRQPAPFAQASHRAPQPIRRQSQAIGSATTESRDFSSCPAIPPGHHRDH